MAVPGKLLLRHSILAILDFTLEPLLESLG